MSMAGTRELSHPDLVLGDVDIGMHAEHAGLSGKRQAANVVEVRFIVAVRRRVVDVADAHTHRANSLTRATKVSVGGVA